MTDPQWRRVLELYETVAALPEDSARAALESSNEDTAVVHEVAVMLGARDQTQTGSLSPSREFSEPEYAGSIIGRYEVVELIGCGSTGRVYSGRDRELGRPVALKFMCAGYSSPGAAMQRFVREARAASALNHPNIVTIHEVITWNCSPVIVMELVEGTTLRAICGEALPTGRAIRIGSQIMQALGFAHSIGVVHRDLKPENVTVRPDGYVKLLDFGLARQPIAEMAREHLVHGGVAGRHLAIHVARAMPG